MGLELLEKITDPYERKARLYPACLAVIPVLALALGQYGFSLKLEASMVGLLSALGVLYLASSIVRELGKRLEGSLFAEWGGKPTTQVLRHRDKMIDPVTKARYHAFLSEQINVKFPSKKDEEAHPDVADTIYQSATKWLLDRTRDKKAFALLFQENIAFGFRRNCLGIKPFSIIIALSTLFWSLFTNDVVTSQKINLGALHGFTFGAWFSLGASLLMLVIWLFYFTKRTVRTAAFAYADMLLRSCDVLPKK